MTGSLERRQEHPEPDVRHTVTAVEAPRVRRPVPPVHHDHLLRGGRLERDVPADRHRHGRRVLSRHAELPAYDAIGTVGAHDHTSRERAVQHHVIRADVQPPHGVANKLSPTSDSGSRQPGVEEHPWDDVVRTGQGVRRLDATRTHEPHPTDGGAVGEDVRDPQPSQLVEGMGRHPVAAALVAREVVPIQQQYAGPWPGAQRRQRRGRPSRPRTHHRNVVHTTNLG